MILSFLIAALAFITLLAIAAPLLRGNRPAPDRASFDQAVYRDQLQELDRDIARGLLTAQDAASSRLEIQRRLLATDRVAAAPARLSRSPILAGAVFLVLTAGSVGLYLTIGAPGLPDVPFASRQAERGGQDQLGMQQAADQLAAKLQANPSDAQGWLLFARTESMLNRWSQAADAFHHAMALGQTGPDVTAAYAESLVMATGGTVTPAAEAAFQQVLKADPGSAVSRYYLAIAAAQAGEPLKTIAMLQALLADMPADSPLRDQVGQRIKDAAESAHVPVPELAKGTAPAVAPGPDANAVAAAADMTPDQRQAMISGMVAQLAAKQAADPGNVDGWLRLGRAYAVLHETDKAADAYDKAAALKPDDPAIPVQAVQALMQDHKPTDPMPPRVLAILKKLEVTDPNDPTVLWFLGLAATQSRDIDAAKRYWGTLLSELPKPSEDATAVQAALDALGKVAAGGARQ